MEFNKKTILTELSVHDIEYALCRYYDIRKHIIVPNVSWGFFREHEADLVVITKANYLIEIEIKRSWRDFLKDFRKDSFHADNRITEFYYCVPDCMVEACKEHLYSDPALERKYGKIGLISFDESGNICFVRDGRKRISLKLTTAEVLEIARLGVLRFWDTRRKYDDNEKDKKIAALRGEISFLKEEYKAATGYDINEVL
ncbi:MAG: hypothetical protein IJK99_09130 [Bacteroidales bacterium]|nr:hypothetical protein [Bacteroidales bacterium]